ncbi:hypothetical protein MTO96_023285 [Rhipicephalus appendiculatus]
MQRGWRREGCKRDEGKLLTSPEDKPRKSEGESSDRSSTTPHRAIFASASQGPRAVAAKVKYCGATMETVLRGRHGGSAGESEQPPIVYPRSALTFEFFSEPRFLGILPLSRLSLSDGGGQDLPEVASDVIQSQSPPPMRRGRT